MKKEIGRCVMTNYRKDRWSVCSDTGIFGMHLKFVVVRSGSSIAEQVIADTGNFLFLGFFVGSVAFPGGDNLPEFGFSLTLD